MIGSDFRPKVDCQRWQSTCGRKRFGFHARAESPELPRPPRDRAPLLLVDPRSEAVWLPRSSRKSGATKTTARPRSASAGRAVVGSGLASTLAPEVRSSPERPELPTPPRDRAPLLLAERWSEAGPASTCAPNRCTVHTVHSQLPTTAQPRSASVDIPVVGSGLASNEKRGTSS